jgi:hypothetical protein
MASEKPYNDIGPEVCPEKNDATDTLVEKEKHRTQKKKRDCVGDQMIKPPVEHRPGKDPDKAYKRPWNDTEMPERPSVKILHIKCRPHQKNKTERNH